MVSADHVKLIAGQLLPQFIPKNEAESTLSFQFTLAPANTYRVKYVKERVGKTFTWQFIGFEEVDK